VERESAPRTTPALTLTPFPPTHHPKHWSTPALCRPLRVERALIATIPFYYTSGEAADKHMATKPARWAHAALLLTIAHCRRRHSSTHLASTRDLLGSAPLSQLPTVTAPGTPSTISLTRFCPKVSP
jgi:hypothetical protein